MDQLPLSDRRLSSNRPISVILDTALTCRETFGEDAAKRILLNHNIPSTISTRVLFHSEARRLTELERARGTAEVSHPLFEG